MRIKLSTTLLSVLSYLMFALGSLKAENLVVIGEAFGKEVTIDLDKVKSKEEFLQQYAKELQNYRYEDYKMNQERHLIRTAILRPIGDDFRRQHAEQIRPTEEEYRLFADRWEREKKSKPNNDMLDKNDEDQKAERAERRAYAEKRTAELQQELANPNLDPAKRTEVEQTIFKGRLALESRALSTAVMILPWYKENSFIYRSYGGGRMMFQQFGMEAIDATRRLVEAAEQDGKFSIKPEYREDLYSYFKGHGILDDVAEAEKYFLNPSWSKQPLEMLSEKIAVEK